MTEKKVDVWAFVKTNLGSIILTVYIIGSLIFLVLSFYRNVLVAYANNAFLQGQQQTIMTLAQELQKAQCQPLSLNLGQQGTLEIMDAKCTKAPAQAEVPKK
jgi:hypothetical protein